MKNSKKNFGHAGQSTSEARSSGKHDANLQKNSALYFQIGLILCLLGVYGLFELQFENKAITYDSPSHDEVAVIDVAPVYRLEPKKEEQPKPKKERAKQITDKIDVTADPIETLETKVLTNTEPRLTKAADPSSITYYEPEDPDENFFITAVQVVPVYPGCEKYTTNADRQKCMSKKISKLISKTFDTEIGAEHGLHGKQKIYTQFTINKNGEVSDLKIRAAHPAVGKEAERVILKIPKMKPGRQQDKPVGVVYTLPIVYSIQE